MEKIKLLELFGGIGACSKALEKIGIDYEITDYVEIDKYAVKSYNAIHNTNFEPQDITTWNKDIEVDLIMHGSPCQDFSLAGKQAGGDKDSGTRSSLMYETIRIVNKLQPKYVIWENVKNLLSKKHRHNFDAYLKTMENLGYVNFYKVLNAKDYGIPQHRERVFTISIKFDELLKNFIDYEEKDGIIFGNVKDYEFPQPIKLEKMLKDMLEESVDEKYYLSEKMIDYISNTGTANFKNNDSKINLDIARPLTTDQNKRAGTTNYLCEELPNNYDINNFKIMLKRGYEIEVKEELHKSNGIDVIGNYSKSNYNATSIIGKNGIVPTIRENHGQVSAINFNLRIRRLTPKECWRLMGFDDEDFKKASKVNSDTQLYKQAGNSIVVNVLMGILFNLFIKENDEKQMNIFEY